MHCKNSAHYGNDHIPGKSSPPPCWWAWALPKIPRPTAPKLCGNALQELHCPRPQAVWQPIARVPLPIAPKEWASVMQELHCPLTPGGVPVHFMSCKDHYPQALWHCIPGVQLRTAPRPLLQGSEDVHGKSCTAHYPKEVRHCIARVARPIAPR